MIVGVDRQRLSSGGCASDVSPWRWVSIAVFLLANALNFLDRQLLSAVAPTVKAEFRLSNAQYGQLLSAFSLVYAIAAPFVGVLIDKLTLLSGALAAVCVWSVASAATGFTHTFHGLFLARMGLGLGESAALPSTSKANAAYLRPSEWGLASAAGSIAVTLGSIGAPLLVAAMAPRYGWRSVFVFSGAMGAVWMGLWFSTAKKIRPDSGLEKRHGRSARSALMDRRLIGIAVSYSFVMVFYMFWLSWTTVYLVQDRQLTIAEANRYFAWIPPLFATFGGFLSGGLAFRSIQRGADSLRTRMRIAQFSAPIVVVTTLVPWIPSTRLAILTIGISLLFCMSVITSLNIVPLDLFGRENAGFTVAMLAFSYALVQALVSPLIGSVIDHAGFAPVCFAVSLCPLLGVRLLRACLLRGSIKLA